jgi:spermidine synthase
MRTLYGGKRAGAGESPRIEVRESRWGRELIIDGTLASFLRPGRLATRSVWDALAVPLLALPKRRRNAILLLGLGGGSTARMVRALAPRARIVGVEFDAEVVHVARKFFDIDSLGIEVVIDDAREVLNRERRTFDAIIEDVFVGEGDDVHKPDWLPSPGHGLAVGRLRDGGLLVSNAIDEAAFVASSMAALFTSVVRVDIDEYDNRVFVGSDSGLQARALRQAVRECPELAETLPILSFRTL